MLLYLHSVNYLSLGVNYLVSFEVKGSLEEPFTYVEHNQGLLHFTIQFYACASMAALSYSSAPAKCRRIVM